MKNKCNEFLLDALLQTLTELEHRKDIYRFPMLHLSLIHMLETIYDLIGKENVPSRFYERIENQIEKQFTFNIESEVKRWKIKF